MGRTKKEIQEFGFFRLKGNDLIRAIQRGAIQDFVGGSFDERQEPTADQRRVLDKVTDKEFDKADRWL